MALNVAEANAVNTVLAFALDMEQVTNARMLEAVGLLAESAHRKLGAGITRDQAEDVVLRSMDGE